MVILLLGKPLVFWIGLVVMVFFIIQITTGVMMTVGKKYGLLKYHKINVLILIALVIIHMILGLLLYF